jgi:hypothetical protein
VTKLTAAAAAHTSVHGRPCSSSSASARTHDGCSSLTLDPRSCTHAHGHDIHAAEAPREAGCASHRKPRQRAYRGDFVMPRTLALLLTPLSLLLNVLLWWRRAQRHKIYGGSVGRSIEIHSAYHSLHGGGGGGGGVALAHTVGLEGAPGTRGVACAHISARV